MNLSKKKELASRVLKIGKGRITFDTERLTEIKEAITAQDIKDLLKDKAIKIKEKKGRKKIVRRKTKRGPGKIKKKVNTRKQDYVKLTRKLRNHLRLLKEKKVLSKEENKKLRQMIRASEFRSKAQLKEHIKEMNK